jgi:hypothetical protein
MSGDGLVREGRASVKLTEIRAALSRERESCERYYFDLTALELRGK